MIITYYFVIFNNFPIISFQYLAFLLKYVPDDLRIDPCRSDTYTGNVSRSPLPPHFTQHGADPAGENL